MTLFVPLVAGTPLPASPSFLAESSDSQAQISKVIKSILKAKRIVVICGAGISVQAGIPDFRSSDGLFQTLKRDNPKEVLASGKDLFDASVFNSEHTTALFCQMIAQLWGLSKSARPTTFHTALRALDDRGKLLRVYTQNIDAIEGKCGLSFGVPEFDDKRCKSRSKPTIPTTPPERQIEEASPSGASKLLCSPSDVPRCVPLHGTLQSLHCQICNCSYPIEEYLPSLLSGQPPQCPECTSMEKTRQLIGKRARRIGKLRPSVVLYNEEHKDGEGVGEMVKKDLIGSSKGKGRSGADLLLVVGTSLRVPGTKRMVREFAKAVHSRGSGSPSSTPSPRQSPRRSPSTEGEPPMKAIYLNLDFPLPTREWEGVFDTWIQGDAQAFAQLLQEEIEKEARTRELAMEKKRKREEDATTIEQQQMAPTAQHNVAHAVQKTKHLASSTPSRSPKKRKVECLPTPRKTPYSNPAQQKERVIIRIHPRFLHKPPEVYISTLPPTSAQSKRSQKLSFVKGQPPITPEKSPPVHKVTRRKGARAVRPNPKTLKASVLSTPPQPTVSTPKTPHSLLDTSASDDEDENSHLLPTFVRNIQYGLRGSGG